MLITLMQIVGTQIKKAPPWITCLILAWMAVTLAHMRDSISAMQTDLRVQTARLDDHIRFSLAQGQSSTTPIIPAPVKQNN